MSGSSRPKPGCFGSDIRRLLLAAEAGQKADILTYSSGHLGPRGLNQRVQRVDTKQQSFWRTSQSQEETPGPLTVRQRRTKTPTTRESPSALDGSAEVSETGRGGATDHSSRADRRGAVCLPMVVRRASNSVPSQQRAFSQKKPNSSFVPEGKRQLFWSHSDREGRSNEDRLQTKQWFDREFLAKQDLRAGRSVAEMHERKLQKELRKLSAQSWPSRDRLAVFSDVFDDRVPSDVIALRERESLVEHVEMEQPLDPSRKGSGSRSPETDYDSYVNHMMASLSPPHDMSQNTSLEELGNVIVTKTELEDAGKEVHRLEQEARRALQENQRVRNELQNVPALAGPGDSDVKNVSLSGLRDAGTPTSSADSVQLQRLQVLNAWREIQQLEEEINQELVSTATTAATEKHIKVLKAEALRLIASNDRLKTTNENLENKINMVLSREKSSKTMRRTLWDEIQCDLQTDGEELHR